MNKVNYCNYCGEECATNYISCYMPDLKYWHIACYDVIRPKRPNASTGTQWCIEESPHAMRLAKQQHDFMESMISATKDIVENYKSVITNRDTYNTFLTFYERTKSIDII